MTLTKGNSIPRKERDSNIELLRIVCMLFILVHHFIIHVFYPGLSVRDGSIDTYRIVCILINGFTYVGVNCFILISGFYGIKFKVRSLFSLYCICVFYALLAVLFSHFSGGVPFNRSHFYEVFFPFSHGLWFIRCYVALFLISPVLNKAAQNLGRKEFITVIVLLTVLNIYLGYYWHQHNATGYNLVQFIYVYLIGAFLRRFPLKRLDRKYSMILYLSGALLWSLISILSVKWRVPHWVPFYYNNPLVIVAAVGLFVFMTQIEIRSVAVNTIASSVLAAYLIQDIPGGLVYTFGGLYNQSYIAPLDNAVLKILSMMAFVIVGAIGILFVAFALDRLRLLLMKPIWMVYDRLSVRKP